LLEQVEESPNTNAHAVFMPAPVRHVGKLRHTRRRRQHLARHRLADVPHFKIDNAPKCEPGILWKFQRRPVDNGRILRTLARQHWLARSLFLGPFHIRCCRAGNCLTRHPQFAAMRADNRTENNRVEDNMSEDNLADVTSGYTAKPYVGRDTWSIWQTTLASTL